jgi:hypothetical protein
LYIPTVQSSGLEFLHPVLETSADVAPIGPVIRPEIVAGIGGSPGDGHGFGAPDCVEQAGEE